MVGIFPWVIFITYCSSCVRVCTSVCVCMHKFNVMQKSWLFNNFHQFDNQTSQTIISFGLHVVPIEHLIDVTLKQFDLHIFWAHLRPRQTINRNTHRSRNIAKTNTQEKPHSSVLYSFRRHCLYDNVINNNNNSNSIQRLRRKYIHYILMSSVHANILY